MTQPIPDVVLAVVTHLKTDASVSALVGVNVFGEELPRERNATMPEKCIVVRAAGGPRQFGTLPVGDARIDLRTYGETPYQSKVVYRAVMASMKYGLLRKAYGEALLHSASLESGPIALREPNVEWPFQFSSWLVKAAEIPIA